MKIPDTSANVGAYYGNEENGQWQPNGVIIDTGVGGGGVGSGDAGIHRAPLYPVHIPRHMPGYVMAGAYYPPQFAPPGPVPTQPDNFEDYMWMENEEEFDKQVIQQLEEEALMEQCIEAMLEDEQRERNVRGRRNNRPRDPHAPTTSSCNGNPGISLEEAISKSTLNPLAAEFVPTRVRLPTTANTPTEDKPESAEAPSTEESRTEAPQNEPEVAVSTPEVTEDAKTEEPLTPPKDPPEVSAADVQPIQRKPAKADRRTDKKPTPPKVEMKKTKPVVVKSETKVPPKKKEVKEVRTVKSEGAVEETSLRGEEAVESAPKPEPATPIEEPTTFKPINYAAAAKAIKPKAKASSPPVEKPVEKLEKKELKVEKKEVKVEKKEVKLEKPKVEKKPLPKEKVRKNSAK